MEQGATPKMDWAALLRVGLRQLGLKPAEFWALTPAELMVMVGEGPGNRPLGRDRLAELQAAFPDQPAQAHVENKG